MLISYRQACCLDYGDGVRYLISISKEDNDDAYDIKVKDLISDISKYPWLSGVVFIGYINENDSELLELLKCLPKHLHKCIEFEISNISYNSIEELQKEIDIYKKSEIAKNVDLTIYVNKEVDKI